jgi:signal transduction histidine kinase
VDENHFSLAIAELFENSRKYIDKPQAVISVHLDLSQGNGQSVLLKYIDNGPGLPPEVKQKVFLKGFSLNQGGVNGGTGLGLFYVAEVVRLHHGKIEEIGVAGNGVCFSIVFPRLLPAGV